MEFRQKVHQFIQKHHMLTNDNGVIIGLSGGADSVALLEILCLLREEMGLKLAAVHVHHGIRAEAWQDVDFCRALCEKKQVDLYVEYAKVSELAAEQGLSVEEAGRQIRYELFEKYRAALGYDRIAVAHHQNDRAETMLFQLFRGSGLKGLAGIPVCRDDIIRPLMAVTREEIEAYLEERGLAFVTDSTNAQDTYARNKIRHHILPVAEEISEGAVEHMNRAGQQLGEVYDYMEQQAKQFLGRFGLQETKKIVLEIPISELLSQHIALQKMIILAAIERIGCGRKDISERHVLSVLELLEKEGEKEIHLPRGLCVKKSYDGLVFEKRPINIEANIPKKPENGPILHTRLFAVENISNILENIPKSDCIKWLDYDKIESVLSIRTRQQGDYLMLREDGGTKSLQDYFINEKIPKSERDRLLVVADGHHIVWVPGKRISAYYKITNKTKRILEVYIGGNENG